MPLIASMSKCVALVGYIMNDEKSETSTQMSRFEL